MRESPEAFETMYRSLMEADVGSRLVAKTAYGWRFVWGEAVEELFGRRRQDLISLRL